MSASSFAPCTDYVAFPLVFTDRSVHVISMQTKETAGFSEGEIGALAKIVPPLARVVEVETLRRTATTLLDTYVGNRTGARILAGQIRRGHVVLYGNIGGRHRLDFTCIGPAVNLAARMEKLTGSLGRSILASAEFASHASDDWMDIGEYSVAEFARPQRVFGLRDESDCASA